MKLNLGCGSDVRPGYTNIDFREIPGTTNVDLSVFPWPWERESCDEIMMLDFLEHFPYKQADQVLMECWRVLKTGGKLVVQVPDVEHCARALSFLPPFLCNMCGWEFPLVDKREKYGQRFEVCENCGRSWSLIAESAVSRLYGGQDYKGNFHQAGFSKKYLREKLETCGGFSDIKEIERNENGESYFQNWNIKFEALKRGDFW
jgi:predicted SAM-dependent methyltransferase